MSAVYEYDAENDQALQQYLAETQRLETLSRFVEHANRKACPGKARLLVDPWPAVDEAINAIRAIAARSKLKLDSDG